MEAGVIRDRVKDLRRIRAGDLVPNPKNWRTHSDEQKAALAGILGEIGYAGAVIARELPDGRLMLIDGHGRVETTPDAVIPVLVVDLDDAEADKVLATLDPLGAMAGVNEEKLSELLAEIETDSAAVDDLLISLSQKADAEEQLDPTPRANDPAAEWVGMPGCENKDQLPFHSVTVHFLTAERLSSFGRLIHQPIDEKTKSTWFPAQPVVRTTDKRYADAT